MSVIETVKSVGDSWILCRSKTYSGRIYYFNTFNGKAVWKLSEPEMEKAKKMTNEVLKNQPHFFNYNCPEPAESPQDHQIVQSTSTEEQRSCKNIPSNVYNKQIISNRFPKLNPNQFNPYNQLPPVQFNIPVTPFYPGIASNTTHPMFVIHANGNQSHPVINSFDYVPSKTSIPLSHRFKTLNEKNTNSNILRKKKLNSNANEYTRKRNTYGCKKKYFHSKQNDFAHTNDLRLLLKSKRRSFTNKETEGEQYEENACSSLHVPYKVKSNVKDENDDDYWLEGNMDYQVSMETINTTLKKNTLKVNDFEAWYIVTDSNVFLNHVNFIDYLMKSDSQCRLLIPQIVMDKLQSATNSRLRTQAHKAAYFISNKVDNNYAIIDKGEEKENVDYKDAILNCCLKWIEQEKRLMLLTDDIELHSCESSIPVYTVFEIKKMLTNSPSNKIIPKNPENFPPKLNRSIKITILNHKNTFDSTLNLEQTESSIPDAYSVAEDNVFFQTEALPNECSEISNGYLNNGSNELNVSIKKKIGDVGVQTDSTELNMREENSDTDTRQSVRNENDCNTKFNKKKAISLKRRLSLDIASKLNIEAKKPFKLHKRRTKSSLSMVSESSAIDDGQIIDDKSNERKRETESDANKLPPNICCSEFVESICDGNNENYTEISSLNRNVPENFPIEKIPTAISNNESSKEIVPERKEYEDVNDDDHVMFDVTSQAMENYLKMKCDEWISRFVQIMEEVLTQVLHMDPPYLLDTMPAPWNIYEAVECVKRKFRNTNDIINAATKLSDVLFEIGGLRGKIRADVSPNKYMEMYSYGVYLIDTLQGSLSNVEDLHIAEHSLSKLLHDIQNPHLDQSNQDLFCNISTECEKSQIEESVGNASIEAVEPIVNNNNTNVQSENSSPITTSSNYTTSPSSKIHDLRSRRKKKLLEEKEEMANEVTFIRNIDLESSFFTSLHLKKNFTTNVNNEVQNPIVGELTQNNENQNEILLGDKKVNSEPKIIRNFTACYEFEEKIKNNVQKKHAEQDKWYSYSESDYAVNEELENENDDEYFYENDYDDYEYNDEMYNDDVNESGADNDMQCGNDEILKTEQNKDMKFKHVMEKIEDNIKETFSAIHVFCINSYETLSSSDDNMQKLNIQELAEETLSHLNSLCDVLSSILNRETSDCLHRIQELLRMENMNENFIHDLEFEGYMNFIRKCLEQGTILKDFVKLVIDASKE